MLTAAGFRCFNCRSTIVLLFCLVVGAATAQTATLDGRALMTDARKGNCVACHVIAAGTPVAGKSGIGPELAEIKKRYPDHAQLRAAIWDLSEKLPGTIMPPYGKHRILTETEIDAVVRYLETL